ncbi:hypothetical protein SAY87_010568 [Trapa incisa]|uniref:Uncharacterized protein n=1 Tax=Trapa incisa TaxID=236973 RepID=A0AAN7GHZ0_9MYRT|nr:hypothetical protein SAY87_010568 [Trapa incisa]
MEDIPLQKIAISGPTLASMIQRVSSSLADSDGLLFGHVSLITSSILSDDDTTDPATSILVANVTGFICSGAPHSFSDTLARFDSAQQAPGGTHLIGWFSGRRRSRLQPSMREFAVTASISADPMLSFPVLSAASWRFSPRVFFIFSTPPAVGQGTTIHTHEYRAYQYHPARETFEPKSVSVVNIGPGFRGHYGNFIPKSPFPLLACESSGSMVMQDDMEVETLSVLAPATNDKELDLIVEDFQISDLGRLMGTEAAAYTAGLEEMYEKMLGKINTLTRQVEKSSARVIELENLNSKLRSDVAGIKKAADA